LISEVDFFEEGEGLGEFVSLSSLGPKRLGLSLKLFELFRRELNIF
jgi:hypothetical protein